MRSRPGAETRSHQQPETATLQIASSPPTPRINVSSLKFHMTTPAAIQQLHGVKKTGTVQYTVRSGRHYSDSMPCDSLSRPSRSSDLLHHLRCLHYQCRQFEK